MTDEKVRPIAEYEREGGACPHCGAPAELRTCVVCGRSAWVIDCGHYGQPRPIATGRVDGSDSAHYYCDECAVGPSRVPPSP
jgi:hypothetical protein